VGDHVELYKEKGFFRWHCRLVSPNGKTIGQGRGGVRGGYATKWGAKRAARRLWPAAPISEVTDG
jgi:uncharacterized protein YegP (UPF0339 family)